MWHFIRALRQHAVGSIRVASSKVRLSGIFSVSVWRFGAGTLKYWASPPGCMRVRVNCWHMV